MWSPQGTPELLSLLGPPTIVIILGWLLLLLPGQVITFFSAWLFASFPIGVLIGHCVVNED